MINKYTSELVARVLLMAYTDPKFSEPNRDLILNLSKAYYDVCQKHLSNNMVVKNKSLYNKAVKELDCYRFNDLKIDHLDDVRMMRQIFYPPEKVCLNSEGDIERMVDFYIDKIFEIASWFITFRSGNVSIKYTVDSEYADVFKDFRSMNKIELWNTISRIMPCDIFIAAHYVNCGIISNEDIRKYYVNIPTIVDMCDVPAKNVFSKGIAETHMHMNAGVSYLYLWNLETNIKLYHDHKDFKNSDNSENIERLFNGAFRFMFAHFIEKDEKNEFKKYIEDRIDSSALAQIVYKVGLGYNVDVCSDISLKDEVYELYPSEEIENKSEDLLEETVYSKYAEIGTDGELIFLLKSLIYFAKSPKGKMDRIAKRLFMKYLRNKSMFFSNKLQSNKIQGLEYFRYFYRNSTSIISYRRSDIELSRDIAVFREQCKNPFLKKLELKRTSPLYRIRKNNNINLQEVQKHIIKDVYNVLRAYEKYINYYRKNLQGDIPSIGIVYNFLKVFDTDNFNGRTCIVAGQNSSLQMNQQDYYTIRSQNDYFMTALNQLLMEQPLLSKYIVGIDAASSEHSMEPWVLAPIFKNARKRRTTRPIYPETKENIANLGFTYHVGEDFRHILSGLRHVDEVIEHFGFMSGDRLGHAVALGIDVKKLIGINKIVCLPIMEYLENLIWIWGIAHDARLDIAPADFEFKILKLARDIYKDDFLNINVFMLREAYEKKFKNLSDVQKQLINRCCTKMESNKFDVECFCLLGEPGENDSRRWDSDKLTCTHFCPCYFNTYNQPIFVEITEEDVNLIESLQRMLIKKIESIGVYVETNPTSNTAISNIDSIMSHPILRLNNPGIFGELDTSVLVTINSDDPNVFTTNVENELALIYHSMLYFGCSREKALLWIDKIREHGINSSFIKAKQDSISIVKDIKYLEKLL